MPELRFPIIIAPVQRENRAIITPGPVKLTKEVKNKIGEVVEIRPKARTNKLIVGCSNKIQQQEAANLKYFLGLSIICYQPGQNIPVKTDKKKGYGVVKNIPLEESLEEVNQLLATTEGPKVRALKRFTFRTKDLKTNPSKAILLEFMDSETPSTVRIGYLTYRVEQFHQTDISITTVTGLGILQSTASLRLSVGDAAKDMIPEHAQSRTKRNLPA